MMTSPPSEQEILSRLNRQKIFTTKEAMAVIGCSIATVGRRVREWNAHTSYNMNGRFYALPGVPEFDKDGIWGCKGALFSEHGNLKESLKYLVDRSPSGLSTIELGDRLRLPPHTVQSVFSSSREQLGIRWQQFNGLNIYFSDKPSVGSTQRRTRESLLEQIAKSDLPSDSDAVIILVQFIKHPKDSLQVLVRRARRRGARVPIEEARNLLAYHGIQKKKPGTCVRKSPEGSPGAFR